MKYNKLYAQCQALSALVNKSYLKSPLSLEIYENGLRFQNDATPPPPPRRKPPIRSQIKGFSAASRKRLLRIFSMLQFSEYADSCFVTLTYHYGHLKTKNSPVYHLNHFLTLVRQRFRSVHYIWRIELQKRGAPHFHIIFLNWSSAPLCTRPDFHNFIRHAWHNIADPRSIAHSTYGVKIENLDNFKKAFCYLSKYVAKEDAHLEDEYIGRRWGTSRELRIMPISTLNVPYSVYVIARRIVRNLIKRRSKISPEFDFYLSSDQTLFTYLDMQTSLKVIYNSFLIYFSKLSPYERESRLLLRILDNLKDLLAFSDSQVQALHIA